MTKRRACIHFLKVHDLRNLTLRHVAAAADHADCGAGRARGSQRDLSKTPGRTGDAVRSASAMVSVMWVSVRVRLPFSFLCSNPSFPSLPFLYYINSLAVVDRTRAHLISVSRCAAAVTTRLAYAIGTGLDIGGGRGRRVGLCPFGGWGEGRGHVFTCALRVRGSWVRRLPSPPHVQ